MRGGAPWVGLVHDAPVCRSIAGVAGVMVSIVAFQAVDPGSIPGPRSLFEEREWTGGSIVWRACLA
jgi:hypothetical protein